MSGIIGGVLSIKMFPSITTSTSNDQLPNIDNTLQSTVTIRARTTVGDNQTAERIGVGLYIKDGKDGGYIITNDHIVKDATSIIVKTSNQPN
jgi:S1-C subfamily serine protease